MHGRKLIAGMDEAGRGPAIGPLVIGLVALTSEQEQYLVEAGVNDSKQVTRKRREEYRELIEETASIAEMKVISAEEINKMMGRMNLNEIEVWGYRELLKRHVSSIAKLYLDAADVDEERFGQRVCHEMGEVTCVSEHKADGKYVVVGAASILAKTERDRIIEELQDEYTTMYPDIPSFGSGYPTDSKPFLEEFYRRHQYFPPIVRTRWRTCTKIEKRFRDREEQTSLDDFF